MNGTNRNTDQKWRRVGVIGILAMAITIPACSQATRPAESEFGLGPRTSAQGIYKATLNPPEPLRVRKLQTIEVSVVDANGKAIEDATITVDGGMPEHGHGLPTQPRVTRNLGEGRYQIEGVRFNMGGWWEFKLAITTAKGADSVTDNVTFNIEL